MMNVLSVENLQKTYGERVLLDNVSFGIDDADKIGLIGINGTGKSTFLRIIAGQEQADAGNIIKGNGVRIEFLPQNPEFDAGETVLEQVFRGNSPVMQTLRAYERALAQSNNCPGNGEYQQKLIDLSQQMDALSAWQLENDVKTILTRLGLDRFDAMIDRMSGGQRKRVALARALIHPSDLLILDEPTNHLDHESVEWLEQYLHKRKGALLMVTHDRYFLDRVANRMLELEQGALYSYTGNYGKFLELKAEREERREASENKRRNLLRNELAWIRRGAQARSTKQKARIDRFEQLSAMKPHNKDGRLEIAAGTSRLGRKIIELSNIGHRFDGQAVVNDFSYTILKRDRVGIVGPNGSGKSTLLNIIAGRLKPDSGQLDTGQTVRIGYFSQQDSGMDHDMRVIDYIKAEANHLTIADGSVITAAQMLELFLFPPALQWAPIGKLSGGERRRLFLLKILIAAPNVLLLDEPTNDLDIQTLTVLEDYLDGFPGALIVVSHDRYFLDRLVDKIFVFKGQGDITQHNGGYSEYRDFSRLAAGDGEGSAPAAESAVKPKPKHTAPRRPKFTFAEQREYQQIEEVIAGVEQELSNVLAQIELAGSDFELLQELAAAQKTLELKLEELLERWTYLNELAERIGE
ncbi:ATP-binding cassette, subfamily F, uup [Dendrosporobacter quercicolus]|uniref:ATP-binding cassette, subfamily F, uup n=2 Tax=Dendrosporobacter quercicolus TaxID=146817 RepID=A0A1G9U6T1_9FIRM|nr:ATP-binding cassette, subfamily F, uup [Dendrosporobacter quercicolus]